MLSDKVKGRLSRPKRFESASYKRQDIIYKQIFIFCGSMKEEIGKESKQSGNIKLLEAVSIECC